MFPSIQPDHRFVPSNAKGVRDFFVLTALFCALVAAVVTLSAPGFRTFARWLLIAESIGLTAAAIGTALSRIPNLRKLRPLTAHLLICSVAIPAGYAIGSTVAYLLLGETPPILAPEPRRAVAVLATALGALFIVYLDAMRQRIENEAAARVEAQRVAGESQLRLLRAQLEPHMLFNTLANLRSLVVLDAPRAQSMLDQLITWLRGTLQSSREAALPLGQEFAQLRAYLEIMTLRMGSRLRYRMELPAELEGVLVPSLLLQPLVENAIKHGIEPKIGVSTLEVLATRVAGAIEIAVVDTGLGLEAAENAGDADRTHYGLEHVRERLGTYFGQGATLSLSPNAPAGVRAIVRIPE